MVSDGVLKGVGDYGYGRSKSSCADIDNAYYISFNNSGLFPSYGGNRYNALPVRCDIRNGFDSLLGYFPFLITLVLVYFAEYAIYYISE